MQLGLPCDDRLRFANVDLVCHWTDSLPRAVGAANQQQLRSSREKFRRAAFIGLNVRMLVADDAMKRLAKLCERECVGRGAVKNKIYVTIRLENLAHEIANTR